MHLPQQLLNARKQKGLTQEELAEQTGITVRTIQRIESGESTPRSYTLKTIAAALDIPFETLQEKNIAADKPQPVQNQEDTIHFLQMLTLSCFTYLVIPFVHFLIPGGLLQKKQGLDVQALRFGRKLIRSQVFFVIALNVAMLLTVAWNLSIKHNYVDRPVIGYLTTLFVMYVIHAVYLGIVFARINRFDHPIS